MNNYAGEKVLVFGFGILGGGVATVRWLLHHGAQVTVTDLKSREELAPSIEKISGDVVYHLGGHTKEDIEDADIVVVNPDVPISNEFIRYAQKLGKQIENEATIFYELFPGKIIAVTGTRGKTTTTLWINHFLNTTHRSSIAGNSTTNPYLQVLEQADKLDVAVVETPSYHLELFPARRAPDIAVITNLTPDHLNRHGSMTQYIATKARLFAGQKATDHLILNADDPNTELLLQKNPLAQISFFSVQKHEPAEILEGFDRGEHNAANLLAAALAAHLAGCSWTDIQNAIPTLPQAAMRQEIVFQNDCLTVINDTTATSPEGAIAAIRRFESPNSIFIFGGTDRQLTFDAWAQAANRIDPDRVVFIAGSATDKMLEVLGWKHAFVFDTLSECIQAALEKSKQYPAATVIFSPGAKSFEKFKNEYDRGEQFNEIINRLLKHADAR